MHLPKMERLGDFTTDARVLLVASIALLVGVAATGAAWALLHLIALATNIAYLGRWSAEPVSIGSLTLGPTSILVPVIGCLIIGLMARFGSEKIRGHGIPEAIEAILIGRSRIHARVAVLKPLSSAISIGSGGPFGAEGPIIMTGGAIGSLIAQLIHLTDAERKTLLVAGAAAGMSATFGTPVAAVLLAVELLLFEWKPRSFIPVAVASAVAATIRPFILGGGALFPLAGGIDLQGIELAVCVLVGIIAGLGSGVLTALVYGAEDLFQKLPIHWMWWPLLGGLAIGVGGLIEPRALGVGYDVIADLMHGMLPAATIARILTVKAVIWSIALGSGTSGGVLAPLLIMGGALGGLVGSLIPIGDPGVWALIGMAAMMGGTMRSPLTATLFAVELTHNVDALLPVLIGSASAYAVTVLLLKRSILTEKIARRGHHISREYSIDPFEAVRVGDIMVHKVDTLPAGLAVADVIARFMDQDAEPAFVHKSYPVVDGEGCVIGMVSRTDILKWFVEGWPDGALLGDIVAQMPLVVGYGDETVGRLADRMATEGLGRLPIVDAKGRLIGIVARRDVLHVRVRVGRQERERTAPLRRPVPSPIA